MSNALKAERLPPQPAPRPAGPRLEARRRAFMDAATKVFLEKGYAGATLDDVIARSGGSRQTLYALFGGKQGMFEALVKERSTSIFEPFLADDIHDRPPEEVLPKLGARYLAIITTPEALGMYRIVVAEGGARREVGELFWRAGPGNARILLARYIETQVKRHALSVADPEQAAREFIGMLLGTLHMECLLGLRDTPSVAEIETHVANVVRVFLDGCRAGK
jgi:AcrR family transcriptional regulator